MILKRHITLLHRYSPLYRHSLLPYHRTYQLISLTLLVQAVRCVLLAPSTFNLPFCVGGWCGNTARSGFGLDRWQRRHVESDCSTTRRIIYNTRYWSHRLRAFIFAIVTRTSPIITGADSHYLVLKLNCIVRLHILINLVKTKISSLVSLHWEISIPTPKLVTPIVVDAFGVLNQKRANRLGWLSGGRTKINTLSYSCTGTRVLTSKQSRRRRGVVILSIKKNR